MAGKHAGTWTNKRVVDKRPKSTFTEKVQSLGNKAHWEFDQIFYGLFQNEMRDRLCPWEKCTAISFRLASQVYDSEGQ